MLRKTRCLLHSLAIGLCLSLLTADTGTDAGPQASAKKKADATLGTHASTSDLISTSTQLPFVRRIIKDASGNGTRESERSLKGNSQTVGAQPLYTITGEPAGDKLGIRVAGAGDINNDGIPDFLVGARHNDDAAPDAGKAYVHSGLDGSILFTTTGSKSSAQHGEGLAGVGDINKDGFDDWAVGEDQTDVASPHPGQVRVYSGINGDLLFLFTGEADEDKFGTCVANAGDVNNDTYPDIIIGADQNDEAGDKAGKAYVYSGLNGTLIHTFTVNSPKICLACASLEWATLMEMDLMMS